MKKQSDKINEPRAGTKALAWVFKNRLTKDFHLAVDGGACVGEWTLMLAKAFKHVYAFEPVQESRAIWHKNVGVLPNVRMFPDALLDTNARAEVYKPDGRKSLGKRQVRTSKAGPVNGIALDSMNIPRCGLLKLDLEGCEIPALRGARETVARCRPVLIVEFNPLFVRHGSMEELHALVTGMNYRHVHTELVDRVYVPA